MTGSLGRKSLHLARDVSNCEGRHIHLFRGHKLLAFAIILGEVLDVHVYVLNVLNAENVYAAI